MFNHKIHLSDEIRQIRRDVLTLLPKPTPPFIQQDNGDMKRFPEDRQMSRLKVEKTENAHTGEARVPKFARAPQDPPTLFFTFVFGGGVRREEGETVQAVLEGWASGPAVRPTEMPAGSRPLQLAVLEAGTHPVPAGAHTGPGLDHRTRTQDGVSSQLDTSHRLLQGRG